MTGSDPDSVPACGAACGPDPGTDPDHGADGGLQAERTDLSWSRTSIAIIVNGLLVAGRDVLRPDASPTPFVYALAGVAAVAALVVAVVGRRRRHALADRSVPLHRADTLAITTTGAAVMVTIVVLITAALL